MDTFTVQDAQSAARLMNRDFHRFVPRGGMGIGGGAPLLVLLFALFTGQDLLHHLDVLGGS